MASSSCIYASSLTQKLCIILLLALTTNGEPIHQDSRCNCVCPDPSLVGLPNTDEFENLKIQKAIEDRRTIYINSTVSPNECNCHSVVLIHLNLNESQADSFCPRCNCKYQTRSLTVIKVVVILVIWVISLLLFYMAFLSILEPMLSKKRGLGLPSSIRGGQGVAYSEHHDSIGESDHDVGASQEDGDGDATQMRTYRGAEGVINRLGTQQSKWKRQVQEQRRNIYDRHSMLN